MEDYEKYLSQIPCFSCPNCYNCRYWHSQIWQAWIFSYKTCPAYTYTLDSIYIALEMANKQRQERFNDNVKTLLPEWYHQ